MLIRRSVQEDVPAIIDLLKSSLGESLIPKSKELWEWKHINNPHGVSPVLVAEHNSKIVGVRAFMCWKWLHKGRQIKSVRAVDTATHPEYQGQGIFKKLTLTGVDEVKTDGISFIYNTPNESSKPGYLKMGWVEKGRVPLKLMINPFSYRNFNLSEIPSRGWNNLDEVMLHFHNPISKYNQLQTELNSDYVRWRYLENPLFDYEILSDYTSYVLFYRIKKHSFGLEMRIVDIFIHPQLYDTTSRKSLQRSFEAIIRSCFLVSASGRHYQLAKNIYPKMGILPVLDKGPIVTLKNLNMSNIEFNSIRDVNSWGYSLGDMELF